MENLEDVQKQPLIFRVLFFTGLVAFYVISRIEINGENAFVQEHMTSFFIGGIIIFLLFLIFLIKFGQVKLLTNPFALKKIIVLLLGVVILNLHYYFLYWLPYITLTAPPSSGNDRGWILLVATLPTIVNTFLTSIEAPIIEEILFRDFFWKLFFQKKSIFRVPALLIVSSLAFGLMHMAAGFSSWNFIFEYSLMGLILGLARYFSNDLKIDMFLHFFQNTLIGVVFPIFLKLIGG